MKRREFILLRNSVFFTLLYILVGCTGNRVQMQRLQVIDSLMEAHPQAAYDSLCRFDSLEVPDASRKVAMKCRMLMAKAQNKLYLQLSADTKFQEVVDYYDSWGTDNEKMQAYYLLGCVYRDQKDAPKAMMSYKKAVECADTLSKECDYSTLSKVYGQIADIYRFQYLHKEAIGCEQKYGYYAARVKDNVSFIQSFDFIANEYLGLGDTLKAIEQTQKCHELFKMHGMQKLAAKTLPTLIYIYLQRSQYNEARCYMDIYEKESGLFNREGNIQEKYEHYYKLKGMFYLGVNRIDSAEYYYRKLGRYGFKYETAQGLLAIYRICLNSDSIKKYSVLCEQEMDKILNGTQANAVVQAASLYDYSRLQQKINKEKLSKVRNKYLAILFVFILSLVFIILVRHYIRIKRKMAEELNKANKDYVMIAQKMKKACEDLKMLQVDKEAFIQQKQEEVSSLQATLHKYKEKYDLLDLTDKNNALLASDVVVRFKEMATQKRNGKKAQENDWQELRLIFQQKLPLLFEKMRTSKLSPQELKVCMLVYLTMDNTEVATLIDTTTKTVNNAKQKVNNKIFGDKSASSLYKNLLKV